MAQNHPVQVIRCGDMVIFTTPLPPGPFSPLVANDAFAGKVEVFTPESDYFVVMVDTTNAPDTNELINMVIVHMWGVLYDRGIVDTDDIDVVVGDIVGKLSAQLLHPEGWVAMLGYDEIKEGQQWPDYNKPISLGAFRRLHAQHIVRPQRSARA